jgi:hypothetical protein
VKKKPKGADDFLHEHGATRDHVDGATRDDFEPSGHPKQTLKLRQVVALLDSFTVGVDPIVVDTQLRRIVELLAKADRLTIESARNMTIAAAKAAKIARPAQLVDTAFSALKVETAEDESALAVRLLDPDPDPSPGADDVLSELVDLLRKYVVMPDGAAVLITMWIVHTYLLGSERLDISPILSIVSPVRRCGKTTLLTLLAALVQRGLPVSNITAAALFRVVEKFRPVLLVDECDTFLQTNDELRGLVNSGHTRATAFVLRVEGDEHEVKIFSTWGAKALALIGSPAPTIEDRSTGSSAGRRPRRSRGSASARSTTTSRRSAARWPGGRGIAGPPSRPPTPSSPSI